VAESFAENEDALLFQLIEMVHCLGRILTYTVRAMLERDRQSPHQKVAQLPT